jgi:signal peptidase I
LIEWEKGEALTFERDSLWQNGKHLPYHTFAHNYYFMGGDKVENSQDSRYWGLVPEEFIVGRAVLVWNSRDRYSGKIRWERVWRRIK